MTTTFKIVCLGDGGVGKTSLINRIIKGTFDGKYVATMGVEVNPLEFQTNNIRIVMNVWDCAGQEKFGGLRDGYYLQAKGAIIFFDMTSRISYKNAIGWYNDFRKVCPLEPVVLCGTKYDLDKRVDVSYFNIVDTYVRYVETSAKTCYNIKEPFLHLARHVMNDHSLVFITETPSNIITDKVTPLVQNTKMKFSIIEDDVEVTLNKNKLMWTRSEIDKIKNCEFRKTEFNINPLTKLRRYKGAYHLVTEDNDGYQYADIKLDCSIEDINKMLVEIVKY